MADLNVVAVISAKTGSEDAIRAALTTLTEASKGEEGCRGYELFESAAAPGTFVTVEKWRSQEDLDAHLRTPHVGAALAAAGDHLTAPPAIHPLQPVA